MANKTATPINISLRPDLERFVRGEVKSGHYGNESDALNAAVGFLQERQIVGGKELRRLIAVGQKDADRGALIDGDVAFAERRRQRI